ncbi:M23 family metallopeptidase [Pseudoxanthomonas winnipegensis]|uniref:M23 family metallopeptidase n=1 Tax=Pseudoxanthomonas winnipegensis TaxID=2480810 RepID=UPI003CCDC533
MPAVIRRAACGVALALLLPGPTRAALPWWNTVRPAPQAAAQARTTSAVDGNPQAPAASRDSADGTLARLRLERTPTRTLAWVENPLPGPVQVQLDALRLRGVVASPTLPVRKLLPAHGRALVATLIVADPQAGSDFQLKLDAVPGDPQARPLQAVYRLPFDAPVRVDQGPGGHFSHDDAENADALDFALPEGTPILAARAGVVLQVQDGFEHGGPQREALRGRSNFIRILHADGSMALYAHLQPEGILVRPGESVAAGQRIGLSGNTGFSSAPHLHFVVQINAGMRLVSVPARLVGPLGELHLAH